MLYIKLSRYTQETLEHSGPGNKLHVCVGEGGRGYTPGPGKMEAPMSSEQGHSPWPGLGRSADRLALPFAIRVGSPPSSPSHQAPGHLEGQAPLGQWINCCRGPGEGRQMETPQSTVAWTQGWFLPVEGQRSPGLGSGNSCLSETVAGAMAETKRQGIVSARPAPGN